MYPSTTFIIEDRSHIEDLQINEQNPSPLFAQFFTSDKGPEEMGEYFGEEFKIFGSPNFARHGQPLLQAQRLINNGARVLAKRIVAPDATLANAVLVAHISNSSVQSTNEDGYPLYEGEDGEETIIGGDNAIVSNTCNIRYTIETIPDNLNDIEDLKETALALFADYENKLDSEERSYPICVIADNGRGESAKKFRIMPNTAGSRNKSYLSYILEVRENSEILESTVFTLNPDIVTATSNLSLEAVTKTYFNEVRVFSFDEVMRAFIADVKNATQIEDIDNTDILFGKDKRGVGLDVFNIDPTIDPSINVGYALQSGSNGSFGNAPMKSEDYSKELVKAFDGTFTHDIFDVDNIILDGIIDANYPDDVKIAIEELVDFREDAFFFRDLGTGLYTMEDIIAKSESAATDSRYIAFYGNSYDVIDEYSKKQIHVTTGFSLARVLPRHFAENRHAPVAGSLHGFVFDEIIEGTMNFLPKTIRQKLPDGKYIEVRQKDELFSRRINFISYLDKVPVLESEYTSQIDHTGFSYINNTLAVQRVVKAIRVKCPKSRYSFMEEQDLVKYEEDVQAILNNYTSNFTTLKMQYAADKTYEQNMTYYAILYIQFKKFVQAEVFRIIAINNDDVVGAI